MANAKAFGDYDPSKKGPIPLFVGVTGHRNIPPDAVADLKSAARRVLTSLMRMNRHTRLIVLSPLSEGADRIVAQSALDLGLELVCPLPMPELDFRHDFKLPHSVDDFYRLLGETTRHFVVPCRAPRLDHENRYQALAVYIVQSSDVLIALWDGKRSQRIGGTAKTVEFKIHGVPKLYDPDRNALDIPDTGPVYHIITPREGQPVPEHVFTHRVYWPIGSSNHEYRKIFSKLDAFNDFALTRGYAAMQGVDDFCFKVTDKLARELRIVTDVIRGIVFSLVLLSFLFFEIFRDDQHSWFAFGLYFGFFLGAVGLVLVARRFEFEKKYLDYRALAEACRIQSFWHRLHLHDDVADHYLHKQRGQVQWIRKALRSLCTLVEVYKTIPGSREVTVDTIRALKKDWVEAELHFFTERTRKDENNNTIAKRSASVLVLLSLAVAAGSLFLRNFDLLIWSPILAVMAALVHGYAEACAWAQHAREYSRMRTVYANAESTLKDFLSTQTCETEEAVKLFRDLGNEALAENGDWFLVHRERPIEVPKG